MLCSRRFEYPLRICGIELRQALIKRPQLPIFRNWLTNNFDAVQRVSALRWFTKMN